MKLLQWSVIILSTHRLLLMSPKKLGLTTAPVLDFSSRSNSPVLMLPRVLPQPFLRTKALLGIRPPFHSMTTPPASRTQLQSQTQPVWTSSKRRIIILVTGVKCQKVKNCRHRQNLRISRISIMLVFGLTMSPITEIMATPETPETLEIPSRGSKWTHPIVSADSLSIYYLIASFTVFLPWQIVPIAILKCSSTLIWNSVLAHKTHFTIIHKSALRELYM